MVIDLTPTWRGIILVLAEIYGTQHDKNAETELIRLAEFADSKNVKPDPKDLDPKTFYVWNDPYEFEIITEAFYNTLEEAWKAGYIPIQRTQAEFDAFVAAKLVYREFRSHAVLDAHL